MQNVRGGGLENVDVERFWYVDICGEPGRVIDKREEMDFVSYLT